jgi:hypothetical protein
MGRNDQRSPAEWFEAAARCHLVGHQACASCGERYCVFRTESDTYLEYYCSACDFSVCRDLRGGRTFVWDQCAPRPQAPAILLSGLGGPTG